MMGNCTGKDAASALFERTIAIEHDEYARQLRARSDVLCIAMMAGNEASQTSSYIIHRSAAKMTNFNRISSISGKYNKGFGFL